MAALYSRLPGWASYSSRQMLPPQSNVITSKDLLLTKVHQREKRNVRLGDLLVSAKLVTREQVDVALRNPDVEQLRLGERLVAAGAITAARLDAVLTQHCRPLLIDVARYPISDLVLARVPARLARKLGVLPIEMVDGVFFVAADHPIDPEDLRLLGYTAQARQVITLTPTLPGQLKILLARRYTQPSSITFINDGTSTSPDDSPPAETELRSLLAFAIAYAASDIHIAQHKNSATSTVKMRIDGSLVECCELPTQACVRLIRQLETLSAMGLRRPNEAREGRFNFYADGALITLRISLIPSAVGDSVVLRVLDARNFRPDIARLQLAAEQGAILQELIEHPHGLILMTGPTGSGKTSTLYTILKHLHAEGGRHITTVEDPVEYVFPGISQFGTTDFAKSLKLLLRHDPDVIMVGEMRDADSGLAAVNAAITGHLVMATLHANDSVSAVHRLLALGVPAVLIASSLKGVLSQRLVRLTCTTCGGSKCNACRNTGYSGRKLIAELIRPKATFGAMLHQNASYAEILEHIEYVGPTLNQALLDVGREGLTDWTEVRRLIAEPQFLSESSGELTDNSCQNT